MAYDDDTYAPHLDDDNTEHDHQHYNLATQGDTTKKTAPVDTVRLKSDIKKDYHAGSTLFNAAAEDNKGALDNFLSPLSKSGRDDVDRGSDALLDRARARSDSLDAARAGKIPATAGKKKRGS